MSNIADIAKIVLDSDVLALNQKMSLLQEMFKSDAVENNNQENKDDSTFKVTLKHNNRQTDDLVYGHKRWADDDRVEMFTIVKETFGTYDTWQTSTGSVNTADFMDACDQIGAHFGRTGQAIKSQVRDVVMPIAGSREKQRNTLEKAKELALEAGFINEDVANA